MRANLLDIHSSGVNMAMTLPPRLGKITLIVEIAWRCWQIFLRRRIWILGAEHVAGGLHTLFILFSIPDIIPEINAPSVLIFVSISFGAAFRNKLSPSSVFFFDANKLIDI